MSERERTPGQWLVGIDEAGYGPNLGPLVLTAVAFRVPAFPTPPDLWQCLRAAVRRADGRDDGRLVIDDSKKVYSTSRGLARLERGVLAALFAAAPRAPTTLADYLRIVCPVAEAELGGEAWYRGSLPLPVANADHREPARKFERTCAANGVVCATARSVVVPTLRFNRLLDEWGPKSAVLAHGLIELLRWGREASPAGEPLHFFIDKQGGRNFYAPLIQTAFPATRVRAMEEGADRSRYRLEGSAGAVTLTFVPRADGEHLPVALASMASKYLREALMHEFNAFWRHHQPELRPTAGYPGDAARFLAEIRPTLERLGIGEDAVWRRK